MNYKADSSAKNGMRKTPSYRLFFWKFKNLVKNDGKNTLNSPKKEERSEEKEEQEEISKNGFRLNLKLVAKKQKEKVMRENLIFEITAVNGLKTHRRDNCCIFHEQKRYAEKLKKGGKNPKCNNFSNKRFLCKLPPTPFVAIWL